ncbi:ABC transporter ATP-binding protein [Lichenifustis flavocetrariae]|uniref:ABC transporter ATP-binding protein n=1 Tax=Lichenifustis flavocetrariae TaxID=2949735 RepID=A0AA41Z2W1_9HYPH|nr:ABC transporter ATP-binding protein [Lichenifustis flavocetrariae]MCW6508292.1 ABC transporter ATP-binding protein [Lichenifustis flavocetrariae]
MASQTGRNEGAVGGSVLRLDRVSKFYGAKVALDDVSLTVPDNAYVALLGASGSGKTVLLRTIAGFETLDRGVITLKGKPVNEVPAHRRAIGFVFQNFALFPHLSVVDNVAFGLKNAPGVKLDARAIDTKVRAMIELVGLSGLEGRAVTAISGGQRQRVALARTLVTEPQLVLLDEPLGALDANLRSRMCGELRRIRERLGVTFLHVTGSETEALAMGDQVIVLDQGRIAQIGQPDEVYTRPLDARVARFLNCYNLIEGRVEGRGFATEGRLLPCAQIGPAGAEIYALRQDLIEVAPPAQGPNEGPRLPVTFVASEYSGPSITSFFKLPSGAVITVENHLSHRDPQVFEPGRSYDLTWKVDDALILARGTGARA